MTAGYLWADFHDWAETPPMGWNSWDCYGAAVNEAEFKANVDVLAERLKPFGYEYAVCDIRWTVQLSLSQKHSTFPFEIMSHVTPSAPLTGSFFATASFGTPRMMWMPNLSPFEWT